MRKVPWTTKAACKNVPAIHTQTCRSFRKAHGSVTDQTVLCHCSGRFEEKERELVKFLKKLLGDRVVQTNLLLVVTKVLQNTRAQRDRLRINLPLNVLMAQYQDVVQKEFGLDTALPVIDIDTMPVISRLHMLYHVQAPPVSNVYLSIAEHVSRIKN